MYLGVRKIIYKVDPMHVAVCILGLFGTSWDREDLIAFLRYLGIDVYDAVDAADHMDDENYCLDSGDELLSLSPVGKAAFVLFGSQMDPETLEEIKRSKKNMLFPLSRESLQGWY